MSFEEKIEAPLTPALALGASIGKNTVYVMRRQVDNPCVTYPIWDAFAKICPNIQNINVTVISPLSCNFCTG